MFSLLHIYIYILQNELSKLNYEDGKFEDLETQKRHLSGSIRSLREKVDAMEAR